MCSKSQRNSAFEVPVVLQHASVEGTSRHPPLLHATAPAKRDAVDQRHTVWLWLLMSVFVEHVSLPFFTAVECWFDACTAKDRLHRRQTNAVLVPGTHSGPTRVEGPSSPPRVQLHVHGKRTSLKTNVPPQK